jgi:transposase
MHRRKKPVFLVLDSLPAHKAKVVQDYVASTEGKLEFHFLPGYAPELNPDEMVWNYMKRTGTARKAACKRGIVARSDRRRAATNSREPRSRSVFFASRICFLY